MWWDKALHEGPTDALYLRKCHWIMDDENWKQLKLVFFFMPHHSDFWVMNHQNRVTKTKWWSPNNIFFVGPTNFGRWVMSFGSYHPKHPSSKQHLSACLDEESFEWYHPDFITHDSKLVRPTEDHLFGLHDSWSVTQFSSLNSLIFELWVMETENTF